MRRIGSVVLVCVTAGCASGPTARDEVLRHDPNVTWRHASLWRGEHAFVLAASSSAAAEAAQFVRQTREIVHEQTGAWPPRGLVLACTAGDPTVFDGMDEPLAAAMRAHASVTGETRHQNAPMARRPEDAPEIDEATMLRMVALALPPDDDALGLPADLAAQVTHVVQLPTRSGLVAATNAMIEQSLDHQNAGFLMRRMAWAMFDAGEVVDDKLLPQLRGQLVRIWFHTGGLTEEQCQLVCERLGVPAGGGGRDRQIFDWAALEESSARGILGYADGFAQREDQGIAVATSPENHVCHAIGSLDYALVVDLDPAGLRWVDYLGPRLHYARLSSRDYLTGREAAEQLERLMQEHPGRTMVVDGDVSRAAALWAQHAFWVRGATADEAVQLAVELGLQQALASALRERLVR